MEVQRVVVENWLTRKTHPAAGEFALAMGFLIFGGALLFFANFFNADAWMSASGYQVFQLKEYWRLWTTLVAHGDFGHLLSNAMFFIPLSYLLFGHFGFILFPLLGLISAGVMNWIVLKGMPANTGLIGMSGVVYWMGAVYSLLYFLIDTRYSLKRRFAHVLFINIMLFVPESYKSEVSYMSHFIGYILGLASAALFYLFHRQQFKNAEVFEYVTDEIFDWENEELDLGEELIQH